MVLEVDFGQILTELWSWKEEKLRVRKCSKFRRLRICVRVRVNISSVSRSSSSENVILWTIKAGKKVVSINTLDQLLAVLLTGEPPGVQLGVESREDEVSEQSGSVSIWILQLVMTLGNPKRKS